MAERRRAKGKGRVASRAGGSGTLARSQRSLAAAQALLERHVANTPLAVIEWDGEYRVRRVNRRTEEMFGWSAGELQGRRFDEIPWVPEEEWPGLRSVMDHVRASGRPSNVSRSRNRRKDGAVIHCEWYNSWLYDAQGRLASALSL